MIPGYEQARETLAARLTEPALAHCERVASTAEALAVVYGVDVELARIAGLLHDWHREVGAEQLLDLAAEHDIEIPDEARTRPYLLHAHTGAADLARQFPDIDERILSAVAAHTVGDPNMSDLDKVVWVADMIEPGRSFEGVDDLREVVGSVSLDGLFARCYQHSLAHLVATGKPIHPVTVDVWNRLVAGVER